MEKRSLYGGWPLVNDRLQCPRCKGKEIILTVRRTGRGTGPDGAFRLGDPSVDLAICKCGAEGIHRGKVPDSRYEVAKEWCGYASPRWVARFEGAMIGHSEERLEMIHRCHDHHDEQIGGA